MNISKQELAYLHSFYNTQIKPLRCVMKEFVIDLGVVDSTTTYTLIHVKNLNDGIKTSLINAPNEIGDNTYSWKFITADINQLKKAVNKLSTCYGIS